MAETRMVRTAFWDDEYISGLTRDERYLFLYFLTNSHTNIAGIYQIGMKYITIDTGFTKDEVSMILEKFEKDGKMKYKDGWLAMKNFIKHQKTGSQLLDKGIQNYMNKAPEWCKGYISIGYAYTETLKLKSKLESKSELKSKSKELPIGNGQPEVVDIPVLQEEEKKEEETPKEEEKKEYGNERVDITDMVSYLLSEFNLGDFKEDKMVQRSFGLHLVNLKAKVGEAEFTRRFKLLKADGFKNPKCNSLSFIYAEMKAQENKTATAEKKKKKQEEVVNQERQNELRLKKEREEETKLLEKQFASLSESEQAEIRGIAKEKLSRLQLDEDKEKEKSTARYNSYLQILNGSILKITKERYGTNVALPQ